MVHRGCPLYGGLTIFFVQRTVNIYYPALVLSELANCIDWINICYKLSLTEIIAFSGTPVIRYPLSFKNLVVHPVYFLLTENIKRGNQGIII
jgi:hypothetical protein